MDRQQHIAAKAQVSPESGLCDVCPSAAAPRTCSGGRDLTPPHVRPHRGESLIGWVLRRLERDQFDRKEHAGAYVDGWNDRGDSLAAEIRIEIGLAELRACDVDELGGEGGVDA